MVRVFLFSLAFSFPISPAVIHAANQRQKDLGGDVPPCFKLSSIFLFVNKV